MSLRSTADSQADAETIIRFGKPCLGYPCQDAVLSWALPCAPFALAQRLAYRACKSILFVLNADLIPSLYIRRQGAR